MTHFRKPLLAGLALLLALALLLPGSPLLQLLRTGLAPDNMKVPFFGNQHA